MTYNPIAIRSEYSFHNSFAKISDIVKLDYDIIGIADDNSTFGLIPFAKAMKQSGKKPLFGVRLEVFKDMEERFSNRFQIVLIARNNNGLKEIYRITSKAWEQFYYVPRLSISDYEKITTDICIVNKNNTFIDDNNYLTVPDKEVYQLIAGSSKRGEERNYSFKTELKPQHVLSKNEIIAYYGQQFIDNAIECSNSCNANIEYAKMVQFEGKDSIMSICLKSKKAQLLNEDIYSDRLQYELDLIHTKGYDDYFLIVSDMIRFAKRNGVLVGPSRGSSAGSLVCYLLDITEIDPIKHDLLFERFIDINRDDLPDIDIDFPNDKRQLVIDYLIKKYGKENVSALANINQYQGKSAISEFAQCLGIPKYETESVKGAIIVRSGGDARVGSKIADTFTDTDAGQSFISKYPVMKIVSKVEGHASHAGKHAAGIIVSNESLTNFGAINSRDGIIMMNKKSAEYINLLKIDVLGLRTLTILAEICKMIRMPYSNIYKLPLDDSKTYDLFKNMRLTGIFQFDGPSLRNIVKQIGADCFNDLSLITALSRPGALNSGGTGRYIEYKTGRKEPIYFSELHKQITGDSLGVVVYQEQMMQITRLIGRLNWEDVNSLRQASSRSMGDSYFSKFKNKFIDGALKTETLENAEALWHDIASAGSWLFNKSHAVSYGLVSYWTAYFKANFPLEFAVANLNHVIDEVSGIKLLRDFVEHDGIEYNPLDSDDSDVYWTIKDNKLLGGLINLEGVKEKTAKKIIADRKIGRMTPTMFKKLSNPVTAYDDLFPCRTKYGHIGDINFIRDIIGKGSYKIIGKVTQRDIRDRNDTQSLVRREGKRVIGNSMYLRLIISDDTDSIICLIGHKDYIKLEGAILSEKLIVNKTYVMIEGSIRSDWRTVAISKIEILE